MKTEEAQFWANCLNHLFADQDYIIADKYSEHGSGRINITYVHFEKATAYAYDHDPEKGAFNWSDSGATYSFLGDLDISIDAGNQQVYMVGKTDAGETCWRTLFLPSRNRYQDFASWKYKANGW